MNAVAELFCVDQAMAPLGTVSRVCSVVRRSCKLIPAKPLARLSLSHTLVADGSTYYVVSTSYVVGVRRYGGLAKLLNVIFKGLDTGSSCEQYVGFPKIMPRI